MRRPSDARCAGAASLEACLVAGLLVAALLGGPLSVPRMLVEALDRALAAVVTAVGADLP